MANAKELTDEQKKAAADKAEAEKKAAAEKAAADKAKKTDDADEAEEVETVHYQVDHRGSTTGKSGARYSYMAGDVIEAPDGDLAHLGKSAKKLTAEQFKSLKG